MKDAPRASAPPIFRTESPRHRPADVRKAGVVDTLRDLERRGIPVLVVSDSMDTAERLRAKYDDALGLRGLLAGIISSRDVGVQKPHRRFWDTALAELARGMGAGPVDPARVVFVGHDVDEIAGAWEYGLHAVACYFEGRREELPQLEDGDFLSAFSDVLRRLWNRNLGVPADGIDTS
ncbi:MAG: HAD family hydrolase [Acidobacteriota bacterium]